MKREIEVFSVKGDNDKWDLLKGIKTLAQAKIEAEDLFSLCSDPKYVFVKQERFIAGRLSLDVAANSSSIYVKRNKVGEPWVRIE